ncbi:protein-tyrosine phosphatase [Microbulbifer donghaiensis]|uniref:protein-tyrosine-phosphatase n=1 Tax=Microbulbifer donghaiensis TaxID=494016 RepID=A0A1M4ZYA5_9GAMM|nr:CpsB/CapC family capsule biosynthesis tyrosine phosphatase [Microbulbifer donghaiensis]SHF23019.1 protein-tyrosine phosphatase [Microbulbifer donghaiensis]
MIDLHCHLLHGIDDGAENIEQGIALARAAVDDGITHAVATPHIHAGRYQNSAASIANVHKEFCQVLERESIPLHLGFAAEVRLCAELPLLLIQDQVPFLGEWDGSKVLLLELPHSHIPPGIENFLKWLADRNIRAMIAHPERNKDIMRDFRKIEPLVRNECLFQVTATSLTGHFGEAAKLCSEKMVRRGFITVLATDSHHITRRPPNLNAGRRAAEQLVGESNSWELVWGNPQIIASCHFISDASSGEYLT